MTCPTNWLFEMRINTKSKLQLIYPYPLRYSYQEQQEIGDQIRIMLSQRIIRESHSPWSSPVWLVPKKSEIGELKWRLLEKTVKDRYPIPNINEVDKLIRGRGWSDTDGTQRYSKNKVKSKKMLSMLWAVKYVRPWLDRSQAIYLADEFKGANH